MNLTIPLLAVLLLIFFSCESENKTDNTFDTFTSISNKKELKGTAIELSVELVNPTDIYIYDSLLVIIDVPNNKGSILLFDYNNKLKFLGATGSEGAGPGEYFGLVKVEAYDGRLYAFDLTLSTVTVISIDSVVKFPEYVPELRYQFERPTLDNIEVLNDSIFVTEYYREDPRYRVISMKGDSLKSFYSYPEIPNTYNVSKSNYIGKIRGYLLLGKMDANEKLNVLAVTHGKTSLLDIYDLGDFSLISRVLGPDHNFPPEYVLTSSGMAALKKESKHGYSGLDVSEKYIYGLYSGESFEGDLQTSERIIKFNRQGEPILELLVSPRLCSFAVDENRNKLYGVNFTNTPLVVFDLPK